MQFVALVHPDETNGGFWTEVPAVPGCGSQGDAMHEATEMTKDAIQGYIESMRKHGKVPPADATVAVAVTVVA